MKRDGRALEHLLQTTPRDQQALAQVLGDFTHALEKVQNDASDDATLVWYGTTLLQRSLLQRPLADGNLRLGLALLDHLRKIAGAPDLRFDATELARLRSAASEPKAMQRFIADKHRERVSCRCGEVAERVWQGALSDRYTCTHCQRTRFVEWHGLAEFYGT
jgi:hypothetical protein